MSKVDQLVETTLNPYLVFRAELHNTQEEYNVLKTKVDISEKDALEYEDNVINLDLTWNKSFVFIKSKYYNKFINMCQKAGFKFKLTHCIDELWEMKDFEPLFINIIKDPDPELTKQIFPGLVDDKTQVLNILKTEFEKQYNQDDIIDKISRIGIESLNEIQKQMLNEK